MDAVKYFEEKRRMLDSLGRTDRVCYGVECSNCPLHSQNNGRGLNRGELEAIYPEQAIEIIEKWSQEHPRKTMLQDFLEKYPNAKLLKNGIPNSVCPDNLGYCGDINCSLFEGDCVACWNRPLEE